jgi:hypothetical protein
VAIKTARTPYDDTLLVNLDFDAYLGKVLKPGRVHAAESTIFEITEEQKQEQHRMILSQIQQTASLHAMSMIEESAAKSSATVKFNQSAIDEA